MARESVAPGSTDGCPYVPVDPLPPRPYRDLCSTCRHDSICGSRSTPERPILFCELFEVLAAVSIAAPLGAPGPGVLSALDDTEHKGLCVNCESRRQCATARPLGGIWHCEEYR